MILLLSNCSFSTNSECKAKTKGFETMLNTFGTSIRKDNHIYVVFPIASCGGCASGTLISLSKLLTVNDKADVTIISQNKSLNESLFINKATIIHDSIGSINRLPFLITNITIFKTNDSEIIEIITTNTQNYNQVINLELLSSIRKSKDSN